MLIWVLAAGAQPALAGPAAEQFEMKEVETEAGHAQFQSQNAVSWWQPSRSFLETDPGVFAYDDNSVVAQRYALEFEYSWTNFLRNRVGIEYEKERIDDALSPLQADDFGSLNLSEVSVEGVLVLVPVTKAAPGAALLVEYNHSVADEPDTLVIGPLLQYNSGPWEALVNLTVIRFLGGEPVNDAGDRDGKWDFNYAAQLKYRYSDTLALSLEAYGVVDRLGRTGTPPEEVLLFGDHDQHRMGPILYYTVKLDQTVLGDAMGLGDGDKTEGATATFGIGPLFGLNENTPDLTLKLSLEVDF